MIISAINKKEMASYMEYSCKTYLVDIYFHFSERNSGIAGNRLVELCFQPTRRLFSSSVPWLCGLDLPQSLACLFIFQVTYFGKLKSLILMKSDLFNVSFYGDYSVSHV